MLSHPPCLGVYESISALAQPQGSLMPSARTHSVLAGSAPLQLLCQLYLQLTCPLPSLALHSHRFLGLSSSSLLGPLNCPHLLSISPLRCPSLFRNGPASFWSAWWESHRRLSYLSKILTNWENMKSECNNAIHQIAIMCHSHALIYSILTTILHEGMIIIPFYRERN